MRHTLLRLTLLMFTLTITASLWAQNPLRVSILGDSYSTFEGYLSCDTNHVWYFNADNPKHHPRNDVGRVEQTWWHQVIERLGARLERNNAFSGATVCYCGYQKDAANAGHVAVAGLERFADYSNRSFVNRATELGQPDLILICGATNDSWCGAPIGEYIYDNWTDEQLHYFRPAMAKMLAIITARYPKARVLFILNSELKESINESCHTICQYYGVPCLDLHDIDKQGGHPSVAGMKTFADQVLEELKVKN